MKEQQRTVNEQQLSETVTRQTLPSTELLMRCIVCETPVLAAVCGRKTPCPGCGFPYPLGDCSDLAEN